MKIFDARAWALLTAFLLVDCFVGCGGAAKPAGTAGTTGAAGAAGAAGTAAGGGADASTASDGGDARPNGDAAADDVALEVAPLVQPVVFADLPGAGAVHLVLAGASVYWTERATGKVRTLATDAPRETPTVVAMGQGLPGPLAVDDANVYWANESDKTIMKAPRAGGAASLLLTALDVVTGLLARDGAVYYGAGASTYKVVVAGAVSTTLMTFPVCRTSHPGALALDADHLYQTDDNNQFLSREKLDGTQANDDRCAADPTTAPKIPAPDTVTHSQGELMQDALAVVGAQLIWADGANLATKTVTGVGGSTLTSSAGGNPLTGFVVDGARAYLAEGSPPAPDGTGDAIEVASIDLADADAPGEARIIAEGQKNARHLVTNATDLYWVTTTAAGDGAILRLPK